MKYFCLFLYIAFVKADIEYALEDSSVEELKDQVITSSENELCQNEHLWKYLQNRIDLNNDSFITIKEIEEYLWKRTKELNREELDKQFSKIEANPEKQINFEAYIKNIFEEIDDLTLLENQSSDEDAELKKLFIIEKNMWKHLAGGVDKEITYEKLYQLTYPHEFPDLKALHERITFEAYDTDKNGFLSVDEFLDYSKDVDETIVNQKKKKFSKKIDLDADNRLNMNEFKYWNKKIAPSLSEIINDERNYLLNCCDVNDDLKFDQVEIEQNCESFLHSLITNYSLDIRNLPNKKKLKEEL